MTDKKLPVKSYRSGCINVSIWKNEGKGKDGKTYEFLSATLQKTYLDDTDKQWKESKSLNATDIPKAILVLNKAFEYIALKIESEK